MKFSIVLPVRNGGEYVKECVKSILSQSLQNFTLHVLDNCSSDGTLQWITSLHDNRIKVYPSESPLTIEENWKRAVSIPRNEFVTLIGHDDILDSKYLHVMDGLISKHPTASLYQAHFNFIDSSGKKLRECKPMREVETAADFLESLLCNSIDVKGTGFMMRMADYDGLGGIPAYPNLLFADYELWLNLTRISYKATAIENCFSFRLHTGTTAISPDIKLHNAFEQFIQFLRSLTVKDLSLKKVIEANALSFINNNCKGLSHRLLRTPIKARNGLSVKDFTDNCKHYADMLVPGNHYAPASAKSIWLAMVLDRSIIGRNLFLAFKRFYAKPVLK